jgi:hypothetical protein
MRHPEPQRCISNVSHVGRVSVLDRSDTLIKRLSS